ncbi:MAG: metal ABC transporter substrate-binding protein [Candidatus Thorarchaeota archaeon]
MRLICRIQSLILIITVIASSFSNSNTLALVNNVKTNDQINETTMNIVASISIVADFAGEVCKGLHTVESIVRGNKNPHIYEPSPLEIQKVAESDLFIRLGIDGLEPWVKSVLEANPGLRVLELVTPTMIKYDSIIAADNPHVWMNPNNVKIMTELIYDELIKIDLANNDTYYGNLNNYHGELNDLLERINQTKLLVNGTKVVVHHPSFKYLFDLLGIIRVGAIEEREDSEPSPEHIQEVIQKISNENVTIIVNQPQLDDTRINQIARDTGIKIAELTPLLGVYQLEDYISMMDFDLNAILNPFNPPERIIGWATWMLLGVGIGMILTTIIMVIIVRIRNPRKIVGKEGN